MKKKAKPQFFALYKDFNDGKMKPYDVLGVVFRKILTPKEEINTNTFYLIDKNWKIVPIRTKEYCDRFVEQILMDNFWANATWEYIAVDWPYRAMVSESRPVKIDVYAQLKPNLPVIKDMVWNYIRLKVQRLVKKENESVVSK